MEPPKPSDAPQTEEQLQREAELQNMIAEGGPIDQSNNIPLASKLNVETVHEVPQNIIGGPVDNQQEHIPVEVEIGTVESECQINRPVTPKVPNPFRFHSPAQKKSIDIPVPKPLDAILSENLPKRWERECYRQFRKGDHITLTGMTFFPGIGALYEFEEGKRGSFCVRPDQVSISDTAMPPVEPVVSEHVEVHEGIEPQGGTNGEQEEIIPSSSSSPSDGGS
jgi:hypothetical protein